MSFVVSLLLIAMTLGGILEGTGALGVVVDRMTRSVTSPAGSSSPRWFPATS